jgi:hypothetical protein
LNEAIRCRSPAEWVAGVAARNGAFHGSSRHQATSAPRSSLASFLGAALAIFMVGEPLSAQLFIAGVLMGSAFGYISSSVMSRGTSMRDGTHYKTRPAAHHRSHLTATMPGVSTPVAQRTADAKLAI